VVVPDDYQGEQKSLGDLLDQVPGLHINKRGGSGQYTTVNVRGSTSAQVSVYIDGVPQNLGGDSAVDLSLFTTENVARIEVYRGYVPVRFTGAPIGGVINIVTKKPFERMTAVSAGVRSFGGFVANGMFSGPLFGGSMLFSATRDQSKGNFPYQYWQAESQYLPHPQRPEMFVRDRRRMNNSHEKTDVSLKWQNEKISIQGAWKEMDRYYPWTTDLYGSGANAGLVDLDPDPWGVNRRNRQQVLERDLTLAYRDDWADLNWGLQFDYKNQDKFFKWEDGPNSNQLSFNPSPGILWSVYETDRWGLTLDAAYKLGERNMLEFRGGFGIEKMDMDGSKWDHPSNDSLQSIKPVFHYEQKSYNLQLQDTITLDDDLWLTLILRANRVEASDIDLNTYRSSNGQLVTPSGVAADAAYDGGKWNNTWGMAVKKNVTDSWTLKATGGSFVRYPNFYELFGDGVYVKPAMFDLRYVPVPEPERGEQWDFTVEWNGVLPWLETPGNFSASYFQRRTENMIGLYQAPDFVYYGNYGTTKASGVELETGVSSTYLDLKFSLTWLESEIVDVAKPWASSGFSAYFSEGNRILNSPEWEASLRGDFRVPHLPLTIFAEHHYTGKVPIGFHSDGGQIWEEKLETINLGFRAEIMEGLQLTAGINDVFNKAPEQGHYYMDQPSWPVPDGATSTLYFPKMGREYYATVQYVF
jgi:outer membrane receptor protein involved in Fe transport